MPAVEIVKAWKDEEYRETLTMEEKAQIPEHPSGLIEFGQPQLEDESLFGPAARTCKFITNFSGRHCTHPHHCR